MADYTVEHGPMMKLALKLFGFGEGPGIRAQQVEGAINQSLGNAPAAPAQGRPAQLTPEQASDLYQVGLGRMKAYEFQQKHGFAPQ